MSGVENHLQFWIFSNFPSNFASSRRPQSDRPFHQIQSTLLATDWFSRRAPLHDSFLSISCGDCARLCLHFYVPFNLKFSFSFFSFVSHFYWGFFLYFCAPIDLILCVHVCDAYPVWSAMNGFRLCTDDESETKHCYHSIMMHIRVSHTHSASQNFVYRMNFA